MTRLFRQRIVVVHAVIVVTAVARTAVADPAADAELDTVFQQQVQPFVATYCLRCHNAETMESGIRLDQLSARPDDRQLFLWENIREQVADGAMPPADEEQPTAELREQVVAWIPRAMTAAAARNARFDGAARRLTVAQYRNTLRDLLGIDDHLTATLPPDGISRDGFTNNSQVLLLSPLQVEAYFDIAREALDRCVVVQGSGVRGLVQGTGDRGQGTVDADPSPLTPDPSRPIIQNFRVDLGTAINPQPCPDALVLGALSELLKNDEFVVTELTPEKPFDFVPFRMQTKFRFIEGYQGNDTVRDWREFDSIYHAVFACVRGTPGYPLGLPYETIPAGMLLRPAIPSPEIFGESNTYGPMANFKISLRELPDHGDFRVTVTAARYDDALLLDAAVPTLAINDGQSVVIDNLAAAGESSVDIAVAGIYQVDVHSTKGESGRLELTIGDCQFAGVPLESPAGDGATAAEGEQHSAFAVLRLPAGPQRIAARYKTDGWLRRVVVHRLADDSELARRFVAFEQRTPLLGVHVGLRRDCGSTLTRVGRVQPVANRELQQFVFEGPIRDFPSPDVEKDNVNYLAGLREIGVRSEYTDGKEMPRLLIRSVEFEGPYYEQWPPEPHRRIFIESVHRDDPAEYAREVIQAFATRAFRRPVTEDELAPILAVWADSFAAGVGFEASVKDALLVVLTSPQFLMLVEQSSTPEPEDLDPYELASKLSYFLWNTAPDERLLELVATNSLHASLDSEFDRMIQDERFSQFVREFAAQWLSLDKFDVVSLDMKKFPQLTRDVRPELRQEPIEFVQHLLRNNLSARHLVESDLVLANDVVAHYYGIDGRLRTGFEFAAAPHRDEHLGGLLTQAAVLAGLSDGREPNPVKRGAWVARKIVAEPPDDPPPNVPKLPEDDGAHLTLRQKLERHRDQPGCAKCHAGIDPWGLPFEQFDAAGRFRSDDEVDASSQLPDGTEVTDVNALKSYLANDRLDQVAFSFLKHTATYAAGRSLSYHELEQLRQQIAEWPDDEYRLQDLLRSVVKSDVFLKK